MPLTESLQRERRHPVRADVRLSDIHGDMLAEVVMTDISCHGVGTDGLMHFAADSVVRVEFPDGTARTGTAMWQDSFWSGIRFDTPIEPDALATLMALLEQEPHFPPRAA